MGRELRRVPPNWEHPRDDDTGHYIPMYDDADEAVRIFAELIEKVGLKEALKQEFGGPDISSHVDYNGVEPTWYQVYETVTEGTPVSPPFETKEELCNYLTYHGDFWDQKRNDPPWNEKAAYMFVFETGYAPSMIFTPQTGCVLGHSLQGMNTSNQNEQKTTIKEITHG